MSGRRGLWQILAGIAIGGLMGVTVAWMITEMAKTETTQELYISDISSINMLYQSRNMQEYLKVFEEELVRTFIESGGPNECGLIDMNNRSISVWKDGECEVGYSPGGALRCSGELAAAEAARYQSFWGVEVSPGEGSFCLSLSDTLEFGEYHSKVCFNSPVNDAIDTALGNMAQAYESGSAECTCFETYSVCQTGVDGYNFTYALMENC
jgi:hypothetical protein